MACLLLVIIPTTLAYAGTNFNYAQGYFGAGGSFGTTGFAPRDYNRVWHAAGYEWWVFYELPNGSTACFRDNTNNPTSCPFSNSYAKSWCSNITDNSGVQWTCQTTKQTAAAQVAQKRQLTYRKLRRQARAPAVPSVALPPAVLAQASQLDSPPASVPDAAQPGHLVTARARVLLTGLGSHNASLYAIPTSKGQVCGIYSAAYGTLGCSRAPAAGSAVQWGLGDVDAIGSGEPAFVDGFAPRDVASVQVLAQGAVWTAQLAHGAFFFQLPQADQWPESLRITRANGRSQTISLPKQPTATS